MDTQAVTQAERYVLVTFKVHPEGDAFVATCLELDVATSGSTWDEAVHEIVDATSLYLESLADSGDLEGELARRGVKISEEPFPAADVSFTIQLGPGELAGPYVVPLRDRVVTAG
jgi:predicted RNase H-like HicB family nuclease